MSPISHKLGIEKWKMCSPGEMIFFVVQEQMFGDLYWGLWKGRGNDWAIYYIEEKDMMRLENTANLSEYIHYHGHKCPPERIHEFVDADPEVLSLYRK